MYFCSNGIIFSSFLSFRTLFGRSYACVNNIWCLLLLHCRKLVGIPELIPCSLPLACLPVAYASVYARMYKKKGATLKGGSGPIK